MTITMASNSNSEKMIEHIKRYQGVAIKNLNEGIYYIREDIKTQIIVID
ncbi:hypothetical protein [Thermoanaerobacterium sp. RBIITD]|nr:hypothetical protein [Thermoanaerobacterium sp. RBIITD]